MKSNENKDEERDLNQNQNLENNKKNDSEQTPESNFSSNEDKKKSFRTLLLDRFLPAIIMAVFIGGTAILLAVFGPRYYQARIASYFVIYGLLSILMYELIKAGRMKWYWALILALLYSTVIILPYKGVFNVVVSKNGLSDDIDNQTFYLIIQNLHKDWITILMAFSLSLIIFIYETAKKINMTWGDRFYRLFLNFISTYFLTMTMKIIQMTDILKWQYLLLLALIAIATDTFGFFGGKWFGKKVVKQPFSPNISPKKTWEGAMVALIVGTAMASGLVFGLHLFSEANIAVPIIFVILAPTFAILGDLYFSYIKRLNGIKDYSKILRGHGGFIDRFDSVSFVAMLTGYMLLFCVK